MGFLLMMLGSKIRELKRELARAIAKVLGVEENGVIPESVLDEIFAFASADKICLECLQGIHTHKESKKKKYYKYYDSYAPNDNAFACERCWFKFWGSIRSRYYHYNFCEQCKIYIKPGDFLRDHLSSWPKCPRCSDILKKSTNA